MLIQREQKSITNYKINFGGSGTYIRYFNSVLTADLRTLLPGRRTPVIDIDAFGGGKGRNNGLRRSSCLPATSSPLGSRVLIFQLNYLQV